jgi:hypothetical protein
MATIPLLVKGEAGPLIRPTQDRHAQAVTEAGFFNFGGWWGCLVTAQKAIQLGGAIAGAQGNEQLQVFQIGQHLFEVTLHARRHGSEGTQRFLRQFGGEPGHIAVDVRPVDSALAPRPAKGRL